MMRWGNCQVVLTDSDQLNLPLLYTYEHKFPLRSLNNGEMEEVSAHHLRPPWDDTYWVWGWCTLATSSFSWSLIRFLVIRFLILLISTRFTSLSLSLPPSSEGNRLKMPRHLISPRWIQFTKYLVPTIFPTDWSLWPPDLWWSVRRVQAVRRWHSWDQLHFPLLTFLPQQSILYVWIQYTCAKHLRCWFGLMWWLGRIIADHLIICRAASVGITFGNFE